MSRLELWQVNAGKSRNELPVPRVFQLGVLIFILLTGAVPVILQALINGLTTPGNGFALALIAGLFYDILRIAPLIVLARHPAGVLHPVIIAVVLWPLLTTLPSLIDTFGGYAGLLSGNPLRPPYFVAIAWLDGDTTWLEVARYSSFQIIALLSFYGGFVLTRPRTRRRIKVFDTVDTLRLRSILAGIIIMNFIGVAVFIQLRGGLVEHIGELAYGRFRALEGLGPLLALFDIGFLALLLWICLRPQDAKSKLFITLLPLVSAQQFIVAGSRAATLLVFVLIGLGWALAARRVPWRLGLILLPIAFLSFGALNIIRTASLSNATALEAAQDSDLASILERSQNEFDLRQSLSGTIPVISDGMRTTGPMWGYTYSGAIFAMVPRSIWPEKPRGPGSLYAQTFLGETVQGTAVPIGPEAEAFWNFHIPGLIIIFAFYGLVLKLAFSIYIRSPDNGLVIAGFLLVATQFGVSTDQLVAFQQMVLTFAIMLGVIFIFYRDAFRPARRQMTALVKPSKAY